MEVYYHITALLLLIWPLNNGMSARCPYNHAMAFNYTYKTAGGGSSGVRIYNYTLPEKYNNKPLLTKGNKITISRGQNGVGGDKGINGTEENQAA